MNKLFNFTQAKGKWYKFPSFNLGGGAKLYKNFVQKLLAVSLCMAVVLLGTPVTTFAEDVFGELTLSSDGTTVTGVTAPEGKEKKDITKVDIPAKVAAIGDQAFKGCSSLTSLELPASVAFIGAGAFWGCSSLTSLELPASVASIEDSAFYGCSSLTLIELPASVTTIWDSAFYGCSSLTSLELPATVTSIGAGAFYGCSSLESLSVDPANTTYKSENNLLLSKDGGTLIYCPDALPSVALPASVASIRDDAFYGCSSLKSLSVDPANTVYKAENNLLLSKDGEKLIYCPGGLDAVTIPATVATIGGYAFFASRSLTSVDIPDSVTYIGEAAFYECTSLTSVTIPATVVTIMDGAFAFCTSLSSVTILGLDTHFRNAAFMTGSVFSVTIPCGFDLKLFGWDDEANGFTGASGVLPASGYTNDYKPTNATTYQVYPLEGSEFVDAGTFTLSHAWDEGKITTPATCTEVGVKTYTCSRGCGIPRTEDIPALAHDLSDKVISEPTAEKLGEVHSMCSRGDYDVFSHYTLGDGASPTMYPDGTRISDASYTPKATNTFDLNGQALTILLQDPLGVLGSGELGLSVDQIELPADFDGDVDVEHSHSYEIVPTVDGVKVSGGLSNKVRLLYKIPQGWDRADLEVFLAQAGEDREFDEVTEKIGDDEYLVVWTDHFSPYVFVDKLNPEEKAELEKLQNESGNANGNHSIKTGDASGEILMLSTLTVIATGLYLGLFLKKKKSF